MSQLQPDRKAAFIPFAKPDIGEEEISAVVDVMRSGWLTTGPKVAEFERLFVEFLGSSRLEAVAVNSATAGLHLALEAAGIGPGDEVIVPTWTFTATAEVVRYLGASPVLVDVDPVSLCLDYRECERAITTKTKAIMPVHFGGLALERNALENLASENNLTVVEDAAHVLPGSTNGQIVGAGNSHATVFSFYATKTIATGEGGMVVTPYPDVAKRMRTMRLHGISKDVFNRYTSNTPSWYYEVVAPGFKYNMTDIAAAIGVVQLSRAWKLREARERIAEEYFDAFSDLDLILPTGGSVGDVHSWHLFVIRLGESVPLTREKFIEEMAKRGVSCSVHFIPLHMHPYWKSYCGYSADDFPVATREYQRAVSLPIYPSMSMADRSQVIEAVRQVLS